MWRGGAEHTLIMVYFCMLAFLIQYKELMLFE